MLNQSKSDYFQNYMLGDVCFGCGENNHFGLKIKSQWQEDWCICHWQAEEKHQGWPGIVCGGILSTLIDCHCMASAMATAVRNENRSLDSEPRYRFATGSLRIKFKKPTPINTPLVLKARVSDIRDDYRYGLECFISTEESVTVEAEVVAFRVYDSGRQEGNLEAFCT